MLKDRGTAKWNMANLPWKLLR